MKKIFEPSSCLQEAEIRRYLLQQSPRQERQRVEHHLLDCILCSDAVEGFAAQYDFEQHNDLDALRQAIQQKTAGSGEPPKVVPLQPRRRLSINNMAAAILMFLLPVAGWLYWQSNAGNNNADLSTVIGEMRSEVPAGVTDNNLLKAIALYNDRQFDAALTLSQSVLDTMPESVAATYYAGLAAFQSAQYELAEHYFMTLKLNSDYYYEDASWLLVQSCLGAGKKEKAVGLLQELIQNPSGYYFDSAKALLEELTMASDQ